MVPQCYLLHYLSDTHISSKFVSVTDFEMLNTHIFQIFHLESTSTIWTDEGAFFDILHNEGYGLVVGGKMQLHHACTNTVDNTW
jgi:hypothetical protein